jgi:hypothetical protein
MQSQGRECDAQAIKFIVLAGRRGGLQRCKQMGLLRKGAFE